MRRLALVSLALLLVGPAFAQLGAGWLRDDATGCYVWNADPIPGKTFKWSGDCSNAVADGYGVLQWFINGSRGDRFIGEYRDGRMGPRGILESPNGDRYDGELRNDKPNGRGTLTRLNGTRYSGWFRDGRPDDGLSILGDSKSYEGLLRDGRPIRGEITYPDGTVYDGELRDDMRSGRGILDYPNGDQYDGSFKADKFDGWGKFKMADGGLYEGEFRDDKPNGFGTYTAADGGIYAGLWTNGCFRQSNRSAAVMATEKECSFGARGRPN